MHMTMNIVSAPAYLGITCAIADANVALASINTTALLMSVVAMAFARRGTDAGSHIARHAREHTCRGRALHGEENVL